MPPRVVFGRTWWGEAWTRALEESASLDPGRLTSGRTYARNGHVGPLDIGAGYVSARVAGKHGRYYRTDIAVRALAPTEWEQVADAIAAKAGHAAALLDGELDPGVVDDAAELDIRLLPGVGDLRPDCSCPDWAEPCKHAAAVCYLVANELDRDPFLLFLLRGVGRDDLLAMVRARRSRDPVDGAGPAASTDVLGVDGAEAWEAHPYGEPLAPVPELVAAALAGLPTQAVAPPRWDADMPALVGISTVAVDGLAHDAAERAFEMLADGAPSGIQSGFVADLARRANHLDRRQADRLAHELGWTPGRLGSRVEAWRLGGDLGVRMLEDNDLWSTDQPALDAGRAALVQLGFSRRSVSLNYDSLRMRDNVWLAIGPDQRWYRMQEKGKRLEMHLDAPPSDDITDLVEPPPPPPT